MANSGYINKISNRRSDEIYFRLVELRLILHEELYKDNAIRLFNRGKREKVNVENLEIDTGIKISELEEVMGFVIGNENIPFDIELRRTIGLLYNGHYYRGRGFLLERQKYQEFY